MGDYYATNNSPSRAWLLDRGFLLDISRYNLKKAKSNAQPNFLHHVSSKTLPYLSYTLAGNVSWRSTLFVSTDSKVTSLWSMFHTTTSNFLEAIIIEIHSCPPSYGLS